MPADYLVFFPDGTVSIEENEGVKNIWPNGTVKTWLWADGIYGTPMRKVHSCLWERTSWANTLIPEHKAMLLLMGITDPSNQKQSPLL